MAIVVSDTSPLRCLSHLGRLDLLGALFGQVLIPPAVVWEGFFLSNGVRTEVLTLAGEL